ncbi:MAG: DUF2877 domain-containing protein [Firmicutes bacterium]|nr:DUF2877 domain-containing protein [Bacillota bacterium]
MKISAYDKDITDEVKHSKGKVHSVFKSALSIESGGRLITFAPASGGKGPGFFLVEDPQDFRSMGFEPDMPFSVYEDDKYIAIGGRKLSTANAAGFSSMSDFSGYSVDGKKIKNNIEYLKKNLVRYVCNDLRCLENSLFPVSAGEYLPEKMDSSNSCVIPVWNEYVRNALIIMDEGIIDRDENLFSRSLEKLTGAGCGLTPGGDDFILGMLCISNLITKAGYSKGNSSGLFILGNIQKYLPLYLNKTGFISRSYLQYALEGRYTETLVSFIRMFSDGYPENSQECISKLMCRGATSGADTIAGILFASGYLC